VQPKINYSITITRIRLTALMAMSIQIVILTGIKVVDVVGLVIE